MATPIKGSIRRSQLISTYGVGAMIPVADESYMVAGLEHWTVSAPHSETDGEALQVHEPRLEKILDVETFYLPPATEHGKDVPVVRFPEIYHCPTCKKLDYHRYLSAPGKSRCGHCNTPLVVSRFVVSCAKGHIDEFPYWEWLHLKRGSNSTCKDRRSLRLTTNDETGSLGGLEIQCSACGERATMEGALSQSGLGGVRISCRGHRPWIGDYEECSERIVGLQRGASNVWFPSVASSISIPPWSRHAAKIVQQYWTSGPFPLKDVAENTPRAQWAAILGVTATKFGVSVEDLIAAIDERLGLASDDRFDFDRLRQDEHQAILQETGAAGNADDFICRAVHLRETLIGNMFGAVRALDRLREVRVLTGLSRLVPAGSVYEPRQPLSKYPTNWLPAIEVRGEGVFLELSGTRLAEWEVNAEVERRAALLSERYLAAAAARGGEPSVEITPRLILAHTFAHSLINQWSLDSGYPAAALRERLYVDSAMAGILIYTSSGDSAGSLGGLVSQAEPERLQASIVEAVRRAAWCSNDPVCAESEAQGVDSLNMASCHACSLLPEVSCELGNRLLDRVTLIGTPEQPGIGFFHEVVGL